MSEGDSPRPPRALSEQPTVVPPGKARGGRVTFSPAPQTDLFQRFVLGEQLGTGGMGEVYAARDVIAGREVAFKRILPDLTNRDQLRARFVREARIQARLEHPSLVPVHEMGVDPDGALYFVMKRVRGQTLRQILNALASGDAGLAGQHSRHAVLTALSQVALAIDFAHQQGVVHRDLKPQNLMLGEFGEVYILDWGLARVQGESASALSDVAFQDTGQQLTGELSILATPGYAPAEQLTGRVEELGSTVDVWALGAILFEVLTREPLVAGESPSDVMEATIRGVDPSPSMRAPGADIPPELDALCMDAMAKRPADRPDAREFHRRLALHLSGQRDQALRTKLAAKHRSRAREALDRVLDTPGAAGLAARHDAWSEIGKAAALDPGNPETLGAIATLLGTPPKFPPDAVAAVIEEARREELRRAHLGLAALAGPGTLASLGLLLWAGVRDWPLAGAMLCANFLAFVIAVYGAVTRRGSRVHLYAVGATVAVHLALLGRMAGPATLIPAFFAGMVVAGGLLHRLRERVFFVSVLMAGFLVPGLLELTRLIPSSYLFGADGVRILPSMTHITEAPFLAALLGSAFMLGAGSLAVGALRDVLNARQVERETVTWQLRQLVESGEPRDAAVQSTQPAG